MILKRILFSLSFLLYSIQGFSLQEEKLLQLSFDSIFTSLYNNLKREYPILQANKLKNDSFLINNEKKEINVFVSKYLESIPFREENTKSIYDFVKNNLPHDLKSYDVNLYINGYELSDLIPNIYRDELEIDKERKGKKWNISPPSTF